MVTGTSRLQQVQQDVEEVKVIMIDNLNKEEERTGKLLELEDRANVLTEKSKGFARTSMKVKKQTQWQLKKMKVVIAAVGVAVVLMLIIVVATVMNQNVNMIKNANSTVDKAT